MEIVTRKEDATSWRGEDAEGRTVYAVTANYDGTPYQPSQGWAESEGIAWEHYEEQRSACS